MNCKLMANFQDMIRFFSAIGGYLNKLGSSRKKTDDENFPYHLIKPTQDYNFLDKTSKPGMFSALDFGNPPNENPWGSTPVTLTSASGSYYNFNNPLPVTIGGGSASGSSAGIVNVNVVAASGPLAVTVAINSDNSVLPSGQVNPVGPISTLITPTNLSCTAAIISYNVTSIIGGQTVIVKIYYTDGNNNLIQIAQSSAISAAGTFVYVLGLGASFNATFGTTIISSQSIPAAKTLTFQEVFSNTGGSASVTRSLAVSYVF